MEGVPFLAEHRQPKIADNSADTSLTNADKLLTDGENCLPAPKTQLATSLAKRHNTKTLLTDTGGKRGLHNVLCNSSLFIKRMKWLGF